MPDMTLPIDNATRFEILNTLSTYNPEITVRDALTLINRIIHIVTHAQTSASDERDQWLNNSQFRQHYLNALPLLAIKMYRAAHPGMGLKEARDAVDNLWSIYDRENPRPF